ncbi:rhodanese-like domain-containing protein [Salegentibacter sp. F188]|uniref:Rhodanese-like domain-containing protein n=1 Tax=Autumnicola patrickiae TaxID=3075591 RepID=A0ABU3E4S8_9FLAO|nr:rhodanese-like domain-containing protein [Salegentibacter sp. F188]MDT0690945.1 rhodanese-like domain-containing protein [Salegentibacter sp. F188]
MFDKLKKMLGFSQAPDYNELLKEGGVIVDVRTKGEYAGGHIKGSKNITLHGLNSSAALPKDKNKPIITCCASGMRSASAKSILQSKGYNKVHNGGSWTSLNNKIG